MSRKRVGRGTESVGHHGRRHLHLLPQHCNVLVLLLHQRLHVSHLILHRLNKYVRIVRGLDVATLDPCSTSFNGQHCDTRGRLSGGDEARNVLREHGHTDLASAAASRCRCKNVHHHSGRQPSMIPVELTAPGGKATSQTPHDPHHNHGSHPTARAAHQSCHLRDDFIKARIHVKG